MQVLAHRVGGHLAIRPPRHDDRDFLFEFHELLQHGMPATEFLPHFHRVLAALDLALALAVVAEGRRLQDRRHAEMRERIGQFRGTVHRHETGQRQARTGEELLLPQTMLADVQDIGRGAHLAEFRRPFHGLRRHIFKLKGQTSMPRAKSRTASASS